MKYKQIYCEKCNKLIDTIPLDGFRYNPFGKRYIEVSFNDPNQEYYLPYHDDVMYEHNHYYHYECWDKPLLDWPRAFHMVDK
jgi:hypothetical protein